MPRDDRNPRLLEYEEHPDFKGASFSRVTLRDLMALGAMVAILINTPASVPRGGLYESAVADLAYKQADAMLAASKRTN